MVIIIKTKKVKIKSTGDQVNINFQGKNVPRKMNHTNFCHWQC